MLHFRILDDQKSLRFADLQALQKEQHKDSPGTFVPTIQPGFFYLLAYESEKPVGYAECILSPSRGRLTKLPFIEIFSFYTLKSHRRKGVMTGLIRFAKVYSKRRGYGSVWIPHPIPRVRKIVKDMKKNPRTFASTRKDPKPIHSEVIGMSKTRLPISIRSRRLRRTK